MGLNNFIGFYKHHKGVYTISTDSLCKDPINEASGKKSSSAPKISRIKCRYIAVLMGFMAKFFFAAHRSVMSITIVAMVNNSALLKEEEEAVSESCLNLIQNSSYDENSKTWHEKNDGEFAWSPELQGYILGSSYLGYFIGIAPGGKLCEIYGCKKALLWGLIMTSTFNFISPFAAWCHVYLLIIVQGLRGLFQSTVLSGLFILVANWAPKVERGLLSSFVHTGCSVGGMITGFLCGYLCELSILGGWPLPFFAVGGLGLITSALMALYMYDNPRVHPYISQEEFLYITENQENVLLEKRPRTPWIDLVTSVPVWALVIAMFGQIWICALLGGMFPTFFGTILHFPIKQNGVLAAISPLSATVVVFSSGLMSSYLERKKFMTVSVSRKFFSFLSFAGCSACLAGIYFTGCNRTLSAIFAILCVGCLGFCAPGVWIVATDMSPTFAGSINSVMVVSFAANFIVPVVTGHLTDGMQTIEQWNKIFLITIGVQMSSCLVFTIFGSADVQPWNDVTNKVEKEVGKTNVQPWNDVTKKVEKEVGKTNDQDLEMTKDNHINIINTLSIPRSCKY